MDALVLFGQVRDRAQQGRDLVGVLGRRDLGAAGETPHLIRPAQQRAQGVHLLDRHVGSGAERRQGSAGAP